MRVIHVGSLHTLKHELPTVRMYTYLKPRDFIKFHFAAIAMNHPTSLMHASHGKKPVSVLVPSNEEDSVEEDPPPRVEGSRLSHPRFWFPAFAHRSHVQCIN